jgi:hypothetical protein
MDDKKKTERGHDSLDVLVQCNMAESENCAGCNHALPHIRAEENNQMCTKWGDCYGNNGEHFKVRCVRFIPNRGIYGKFTDTTPDKG